MYVSRHIEIEMEVGCHINRKKKPLAIVNSEGFSL